MGFCNRTLQAITELTRAAAEVIIINIMKHSQLPLSSMFSSSAARMQLDGHGWAGRVSCWVFCWALAHNRFGWVRRSNSAGIYHVWSAGCPNIVMECLLTNVCP